MVIADARQTISTSCPVNGNDSVEIQAAVVEAVGQVDGVGTQQRDQVRTRLKVLRPTGIYECSTRIVRHNKLGRSRRTL